MNEAEASRPRTEAQRAAISAVSRPSPQPMSRMVSVDCGSRYCNTLVVSFGTNDAAALYACSPFQLYVKSVVDQLLVSNRKHICGIILSKRIVPLRTSGLLLPSVDLT